MRIQFDVCDWKRGQLSVDCLLVSSCMLRIVVHEPYSSLYNIAPCCFINLCVMPARRQEAWTRQSPSWYQDTWLCSQCQSISLVELSQQQSLSLTVDGLLQQKRGMWCEKWRRRNVSGEPFYWLASFLRLLSASGMRVSLPFFCSTLLCEQFRRLERGRAPPFESVMAKMELSFAWFVSFCGPHM